MNPLTQLIPAKYRKYVYVVAAAAVFVYGLWQLSEGDVRAFLVSIASALVAGLAGSNTGVNEAVEDNDGEELFADEENFYDGHQA